MKLKKSLPLVFLVSLVVTLLPALYGMYGLRGALEIYDVDVKKVQAEALEVSQINTNFKTQVQEWKNVLIRGKDAKLLEKHWGAFIQMESKVNASAKKLLEKLDEGEAKATLKQFIEQHEQMGQMYRVAQSIFIDTNFDAKEGDLAVTGMDRQPVMLLQKASDFLSQEAQNKAEQTKILSDEKVIHSLLSMFAFFAVSFAIAIGYSRKLLRTLGADPKEVVVVLKRLSSGDLERPVRIEPNDHTSLMAHVKAMQISLSQTVENVRANAQSVGSASQQISAGNEELSSRTEQQASALEQTTASMQQLGATMQQSSSSVKEASEMAKSAAVHAQMGGDVVSKVVQTMGEINKSSRKIEEITSVIDGIAFQTNILALNAAVEAARAGEHGRGFAVVATEVRTLASRSGNAAKEIKALIGDSVAKVDAGTVLVDEAGQSIKDLVDSIKNVSDKMEVINKTNSEEREAVHQIGLALTELDGVTQKNASLVEEVAAAAKGLNTQSQDLNASVEVFKLPTKDTLAANQEEEKNTSPVKKMGVLSNIKQFQLFSKPV